MFFEIGNVVGFRSWLSDSVSSVDVARLTSILDKFPIMHGDHHNANLDSAKLFSVEKRTNKKKAFGLVIERPRKGTYYSGEKSQENNVNGH